jgi:hypothetical protein
MGGLMGFGRDFLTKYAHIPGSSQEDKRIKGSRLLFEPNQGAMTTFP